MAGASGFVGQALVSSYRSAGRQVDLVGRREATTWDDPEALTALIDGASAVVNLAGKSVNCRYVPANRAEILRSRVETTRALATAIADTRRVALRTAIVLGDGSALRPLVALTKLGLGGPQCDGPWPVSRRRREAGTEHEPGSRGGAQRFSWVHLDDVVRAHHWVEAHPEIDGAVNVSSPNPETNRELMAHLRDVLHRPIGLPAHRWMLELGTWALRTETELVLKSRWVLPERLEAAGFRFEHPSLRAALASILTQWQRASFRAVCR